MSEYRFLFGFLCFLFFSFLYGWWIHWFLGRIDKAQKAYDLSVKRCHCCKRRLHF